MRAAVAVEVVRLELAVERYSIQRYKLLPTAQHTDVLLDDVA